MHKISDKFEFRPDRTTDYRVIRPWAFPLTLNGENDVSIFSQLLWIQTSANLQEMRTGIKSRTGLNFGRIWPSFWSYVSFSEVLLTTSMYTMSRLEQFRVRNVMLKWSLISLPQWLHGFASGEWGGDISASNLHCFETNISWRCGFDVVTASFSSRGNMESTFLSLLGDFQQLFVSPR